MGYFPSASPSVPPVQSAVFFKRQSALSYKLLGVALLVCISGCSFPTDAEPFSPSTAEAFTLLGVSFPNPIETTQPVNPTITLSFSDVLDSDTGSLVTIRAGSRGTPAELLLEHNLVERKLLVRPKSNLTINTEFQLDIGTSLRSLAGVPLDKGTRLTFRTGANVLPPVTETPLVLADVIGSKGQLKSYCAATTCHSAKYEPAARGLDLSDATPAIRNHLVSASATGSPEGLRLVQPMQPEKSYLLRKLLAGRGFTRIMGSSMPVDSVPIPADALLSVQAWIRQGAN